MEHCNIDNYMIPSYFCRQGLGYGGSLIMAHQSLECRILTQITDLSMEKICELSAILIPQIKLVVITLYHAPSGDFQEFLNILSESLTLVDTVNMNVLVGGDFNVLFNPCDKIVNFFVI